MSCKTCCVGKQHVVSKQQPGVVVRLARWCENICGSDLSIVSVLSPVDTWAGRATCFHNCVPTLVYAAKQRVASENKNKFLNLPWVHKLLNDRVEEMSGSWGGSRSPLGLRSDYINKLTGQKKERYEIADMRIYSGLTDPYAGFVKIFVKEGERIDPTQKVQTPRVIQYFNEPTGLLMSTVFSPLEKMFFNSQYHGDIGLPIGRGKYGKRIFAKGLTSSHVARCLEESYAMFKDPVVPSMDCSKFDKTVGEALMTHKFSFYSRLLSAESNAVMQRFSHLYMHPLCKSKSGVSYRPNTQLFSGAFDTSLTGNVVMALLYGMFRAALNSELQCEELYALIPQLRGPKLDAHDVMIKINGDDCLVLLERPTLDRFSASVEPFFALFGLDIRVDGQAEEFEHIQWCQHRPIQTTGRVRMVRDPRKVILAGLAAAKFTSEAVQAQKDHLYTIGYMELLLNPGIPVLQTFSEACMRVARGGKLVKELFQSNYRASIEEKAGNDAHSEDISYETRQSFSRAWGISPLEQYDMEQAFESWTIDWDGEVGVSRFDNDKWRYIDPFPEYSNY